MATIGQMTDAGGTREASTAVITAAVRVAEAMSSASTTEQCGSRLFEATQELVPHVAANLVLPGGDAGDSLRCVASYGYSERTNRRLTSSDFIGELDRLGMRERATACRIKDIEPGVELTTVTDYLHHDGFGEGVTVTLIDRGGTLNGVLNLSVHDENQPTELARDVLQLLAPLVSSAISPARYMEEYLAAYEPDWAVLLSNRGVVTNLVDRAAGPLACPDVVRLVHRQLQTDHGRWLAITGGELYGIRADQRPRDDSVIVTATRDVNTRTLTYRELQVLTAMMDGYTNPEIASMLQVARRTVATHVESVLDKLGVPNRAAAVSIGTRYGLRLLDPRLSPAS